jgi:hypothetical protein
VNHQATAPSRATAPRRLTLAFAALALAVAGCSSSGDKKLTSSDLSAAMPAAQDIGAGFTRDRAAETDTNNTKLEVRAECEPLLNGDEDKGKVRAKREFKDDQDRTLDVSATITTKELSTLEKAAAACKEVPFTSGTARGVIKVKVAHSDGYGDDADALDLELVFSEPITATLKGHGILAKRGDVGMTVIGLDAVDNDGNVTSIDRDTVDKVARQLDQKIEAAQR